MSTLAAFSKIRQIRKRFHSSEKKKFCKLHTIEIKKLISVSKFRFKERYFIKKYTMAQENVLFKSNIKV
jgi:hypothetical protein